MESKSQVSPHTDRFEDEEASSLEDYDSEWTQVSGAEDDSDYPPLTAASDRPLSRADTTDGSIDGDIWEGFIDAAHRSSSQVSIQSRPTEVDATIEAPPDTGVLEPSVDSGDHEEEVTGVTAESSFTGTLRASRIRSACSSLQASMTDSQSKLRLSFPDPLSSREDLDAGPVTDDMSASPNLTEDCNNSVIAGDDASSFTSIKAPLGCFASETPDEATPPALTIPTTAAYILTLFLYGSTTTAKWNIVERIIAQLFGNDALSVVDGVSQRSYYFDRVSYRVNLGGTTEHGFYIRVFDRTSSISEESPDGNDRPPSVAILLLPSSLPADLPKHDFYLPLISTGPFGYGSPGPILASTLSAQITADSASYTWSKLHLPKERVIVLDKQRPHAIMDASALESIDASTIFQAFSVAFSKADAELDSPSMRGVQKLFPNKWHALAFFATSLLAVTVGGIQINRSATSALAPANITVDGGVFSVTTSTLMHAVPPVTSLALATQSEPRSLTSLDGRTTKCSTSGLVDRNIGSSKSTDAPSSVSIRSIATATSQIHDDRRSKARSWIDRVNFSLGEYMPRDLIVWPVDTICFNGGRMSSSRDSASAIKSLSLRTVQNSLAVVSSKGKALKETAEKDMLVIHEAIDELLRVLGRQINIATDDLKDASTVAQSGFSFRNARARENARRLRHVGEYFVKTAGTRLRSKGKEVIKMASQVREGARAIRQEAANLHRSRRSRWRQDRRNANKRPEMTSGQVDSGEKGQRREKDRIRNSKHHDRRMRRSRSEL